MQAVNQTPLEMETINSEIDGYTVEISTDMDTELLHQYWLSLESQQSVPFFLSWTWVGCWIETYKPELIVVSAHQRDEQGQDKLVAIGLFTRSVEHRRFLINSRQLRLNQTGKPEQDQVWVEFNDFLCAPAHLIPAGNACLKALHAFEQLADEIILSMTTRLREANIREYFPGVIASEPTPCYESDLQAIRDDGKSFIESLKSNTRYQVRRSIRLYEAEYGKLALTAAQSEKEAIDLFRQAGEFHRQRWPDSGYNNPEFVRFHENLVHKGFDDRQIQVIRISADETTIAILYYQISDKTVFFYLQGLRPETNPKLKPGLVAHAMASQHFIELGMDTYDYMGGYSQYKEQLANHSTDMFSVCIQQPRFIFVLEKIAKSIKNTFF